MENPALKEENRSWAGIKWVMTLRARLILLVMIAMLPALAIIVDMTIEQRDQHKASTQESVLQIARLAVKQHESLFLDTRQLLNLLQEMTPIREIEPGACSRLLAELLFGNLHYANFGVIKPDGTVPCSGVRSDSPINLADRPYFRQAMQTKRLSMGDYQIGRFVKKPVQIIAEPILDAGQQVQSVVYAALNLDWLNRLISVAALPPNSSVTLIDRQGVILARTPNPDGRWTGVDLGQDVPIARQFIASGLAEQLAEGAGVDGVQRVFALASLGSAADQHGYILVGIPSETLYTDINARLLPQLSFVGTIFLFISLIAWFSGNALILKRTQALSATTRQLRNGDLSARADIRGHDEIAHLGTEFNQMAETLQENLDQIQRLNRIHAVLSSINGAILRIRERDTLLQEACRIAVERGNLRFAWIGLVDDATGELHRVAWHGEGETYLQGMCLLPHSDAVRNQYPCAIAVRNGRPEIHNNIDQENGPAPWYAQALAQGYRAIAAFPLQREGRSIGVLGLYSAEAGFFADQETDLFMELAADISLGLEYIDKDQRIAHLLYHDPLTGLPNRRLCTDRLRQSIARAQHHKRHIGVIVINVMGFRRVVGVYGNHIADAVLNRIAQHLLGKVRDGDTIARLEGDEFALVLCDMASMEDAIELAETLITGIPSVMPCSGHDIHLTLRAGVAMYPGDGEDAETLLRNATLASAIKKAAAEHHQVNFYSHEVQQAAEERERLEYALRLALKDGRELELHYQPVVDIVTHRIVGLEALARWQSPQFGTVSPARFIPIAEASGLIKPFGDWVLSTACRQIEAWHQSGLNEIRVAVNVSFHQLRDGQFIEHLDSVLGKGTSNLRHHLAIELTESELMDDSEMTIGLLEALKSRNIATYIDDFGTGYSSLSYLQSLPVHVVKIDQSFIRKLGESNASTAIVRTVIALAQSLNLKTIAEGVETREQLALLQQLGCDYVQGYLFCKPKPVAEISRLLEAGAVLLPGMQG